MVSCSGSIVDTVKCILPVVFDSKLDIFRVQSCYPTTLWLSIEHILLTTLVKVLPEDSKVSFMCDDNVSFQRYESLFKDPRNNFDQFTMVVTLTLNAQTIQRFQCFHMLSTQFIDIQNFVDLRGLDSRSSELEEKLQRLEKKYY